MKVYIERNDLRLELTQYREKNADFIRVYFCEAMGSLQYRPPIGHRTQTSSITVISEQS